MDLGKKILLLIIMLLLIGVVVIEMICIYKLGLASKSLINLSNVECIKSIFKV